MAHHKIIILAIETSCDETAASVLEGQIDTKEPQFKTLSSIVRSQIKLHSKFGGVVPEIAARAHVATIRSVVEKALSNALPFSNHLSPLFPKIDYIAVTVGPGLVSSLLVGVEFAKALAFATNKKMIAVNHMEGHLYSPFGKSNLKFKIRNLKQKSKIPIPKNNPQFPILSMIVSGGHTMLVIQKDEAHYKTIGSTVDDAAGEAFDKVAKLLGMPYPGGPQISKLAMTGEASINFPRPMINSKNYDFSFSGLKTAVLYYLEDHYSSQRKKRSEEKMNLHHFNFNHIPTKDKADISSSFEEAVVDVLVTKAMRAAKKYDCKTISLSGGVAANKRLRAQLQMASNKSQVKLIVPDFRLCTDNAEMIAIAAYFKLRAGHKPVNFEKVKADSGLEL